uniref:Deoxyribose-phosphate aldolase n=1 Tax=Salarias fasciatus TaxID=181472 RepID=A0A672H676_SALFA
QSSAGPGLYLEVISRVRVNTQAVQKRAQHLQAQKIPRKQFQTAWLLKAVTCIDLTTLSGDDTPSNVHRLCMKAIQPIRADLLEEIHMHDKGCVTTAAVCVYPSRVADAVKSLKAANCSLPVPQVGSCSVSHRVPEVRLAVRDGATEIDIVISRLWPSQDSGEAMYDEIRQFREVCGDAHMKTILAVGELGTFTNVYKASMVAMMAGSDFIKTSTGKESVNATYPVAVVMARAIRDYFLRTGHKVGFKPAGGIRTAQESLLWLMLIKEELGGDWLRPHLFRFGASSLLADIERQISHQVTGRYAAYQELPLA